MTHYQKSQQQEFEIKKHSWEHQEQPSSWSCHTEECGIIPRTVRQKILAGARKWIGPWEGIADMLTYLSTYLLIHQLLFC